MKKMRNTKSTLISVISIALCAMLLVGTTFAWFVDVASNKDNEVTIASFGVDLLAADGTTSIKGGTGDLFVDAKLEPGSFVMEKLYAKNIGELDLKHQIAVKAANADVNNYLECAIVIGEHEHTTWEALKAAAANTAFGMREGVTAEAGNLVPGASQQFTVAVYMKEDAPATAAGTSAKITVKVNAGQTNEAAPYTQVVNLLKNGDFSLPMDSETNWAVADQDAANGCVGVIKADEANTEHPNYYSSTRAQGFKKAPKITQTVAMTENTVFTLSGDIMNVTYDGATFKAKHQIDLVFLDANGDKIGDTVSTKEITVAEVGVWQAFSAEFTAPAGTASVQIQLRNVLGYGEICYDNFVLAVKD